MHNVRMVKLPAEASDPHALRSRARRSWLVFAAVALVLLAAGLLLARDYGRSQALAGLAGQSRIDASLKASLLRAVVERQRALPLVLADDAAIRGALLSPDRPSLDRINRKLEALATSAEAAVIYLIDRSGVAVAASNWQEPTSFVGNDYAFRDYFRLAVRDGMAEHFAMGTVSNRPGLYISRRVDGPGGPLGVIVAKLEFDGVEADWQASGKPAYVTDRRGIVLITSLPSWRFMTTKPIAEDRLAPIRESLQFGDATLLPLPFRKIEARPDGSSTLDALLPGDSTAAFLRVETMVPSTNWRLEQLSPLKAPLAAGAREAQLLTLAALVPLLALAALLLRRRQVVAMRSAEERLARNALEASVEERTRDLRMARDRLETEIADHRQTTEKLQAVQQDLVQANRLAILGQVAAGVAHEINQPVATIRAYADNARTFLHRGQTATAAENMESIAELTERVGAITHELRRFARKGHFAAGPTAMKEVVEGALMLLRSRFAGRMDAIRIDLPPDGLQALGNRIRLEQVLINLLQNALEAIGDSENGTIQVRCEEAAGGIALTVADNGPGIAADVREELFTPFNTSKEDGLGLGLAISKEIVSDYGGTIEVESGPSGTTFTVNLKKA
ncbi:GHKL domain-containing protein [Sinorhizobium meliloti]|uniref:sensor histidine kinase n=1 Tax=Rhizobium meliloti TaxID=382 RepID=UPI0004223FF6|nr:sensor histidine kinase [Sinorhizobium meliloti]MDE3833619.1 sensor histidine kinase [Sinorhizobium meliloti]MDE4580708.1 sensor histidine kinase [Sinorhizobium meliloti]MDW9366259.1 GHKL domain-containing protein [Sinorhizobium meliloti]MDW9503947.1 GHKL domain-containing protein [Sinorhizobium meliloti]MDW9515758.1 GHKL domain-containing protein [Sinorhizobium meliloti]